MRLNLLLTPGAYTRVGAASPAAVSSLSQNAEQVNTHSRTNSSSDTLGIVCFSAHDHEQRYHRQVVSGSGRGETTSHFVCCLFWILIGIVLLLVVPVMA
jgi:hypothetical protein